MTGFLEQLIRPKRKAMFDLKAMELVAAREILAEVFRIKLTEVDRMIQDRFHAEDMGSKENGLWPQEFWLEG